MTPVLDLQIYTLLKYLKRCLLEDTILQGWLSATGDQLCRGTYQVQPIYDDQGKIGVDVTQLPCIAAYVTKSTWDPSSIPGGMEESIQLWYVFDTPIDDVTDGGIPVSGLEKAEIWKRAVWDRICYWLRTGSVTYGEEDTTIDLMSDGKIDTIYPVSAEYFPPGNTYGGFRAQLDMTRVYPPFAVDAPGDLDTITYHMATGDTLGTAGSPPEDPDGIIVEGQVTGLNE